MSEIAQRLEVGVGSSEDRDTDDSFSSKEDHDGWLTKQFNKVDTKYLMPIFRQEGGRQTGNKGDHYQLMREENF